MKIWKMVGIIIIATLPHVALSMIIDSCELSPIEQHLILRELEKRGKGSVLAEITQERSTSLKRPVRAGCYSFTIPTLLEIKDVFYKDCVGKDSLTKDIFERIEAIEQESGSKPNNHLGTYTSYYWVKEKSTVRVESEFLTKNQLLEMVNNYKG